MTDDGAQRRKPGSGVLDAIFEAVQDKPEAQAPSSSPFRAAALAHLDVPVQVDNLLPITSRRTWVAVGGVALIIVAFLAYAAATTTVDAVPALGRAVASDGVVEAVSPDAGIITAVLTQEQVHVSAGEPVASGVTRDGTAFSVQAPIDGTVWQNLILSGGAVAPGSDVLTVLPDGSDGSVLVAVDEVVAASLAASERIEITPSGAAPTTAHIVSISAAPIPAEIADQRLAMSTGMTAPVSMVVLKPDAPVPAGAEVAVSFVLSENTLLQNMLGIS